jgi:hypothetical protein
MSLSSTGLCGSATIVNSDLFNDVEVLKEQVTTLSTSYSTTTNQYRDDLSQNRLDAEKDFTPEVVEYVGAEYFEGELHKKVSAVRERYEKKQLRESADGGAAAAGAAASKKKKKRKPQFSPATEEMDVSPTGATAPLLLEGVVSPENPRTDIELEILHQETVQKTAQIIDAIRSFDIHALSGVEHNLKECKKLFKKEYTRNTQYIKFFAHKNKRAETGKKK